MNATLTRHAEERITHRLNTLVTKEEVVRKLWQVNVKPSVDEPTYIIVKSVPYTEIADPDVKPDGIARGDSVVAVVRTDGRQARVTTVMLRKSWSKSSNYRTFTA
jgi:hypothetical protein